RAVEPARLLAGGVDRLQDRLELARSEAGGARPAVAPASDPLERDVGVARADQPDRLGRPRQHGYVAVGQQFDRRGRRMDEMLDVMQLLWTGEPVSYRGEFYQHEDVVPDAEPRRDRRHRRGGDPRVVL